jgi:shikimate kinase
MRLALIGMSGVGKSYWAERLAGAGFHWVHADALVAAKLEVAAGQRLRTLEEMGQWLGFPYEARYAAGEALYVQHETAVLQEIVAGLSGNLAPAGPLVVDLGGSAIYGGEALFKALRRVVRVVYLEISPEVHEQMFQAYASAPRPLIWRGVALAPEEMRDPAILGRAYRELIAYRERVYAEFCDRRVAYERHREPGLTVEAFLGMVGGRRKKHL